jgi:hypothetical protein
MSDEERLKRARAFAEAQVGKPHEYGDYGPMIRATAPMDPALAAALWVAMGLPLPSHEPGDTP